MPLTQGQVVKNRYRIVKQIGAGGFGAVYRAWDTAIKSPCAIKENLNTTPAAQHQFENEATLRKKPYSQIGKFAGSHSLLMINSNRKK